MELVTFADCSRQSLAVDQNVLLLQLGHDPNTTEQIKCSNCKRILLGSLSHVKYKVASLILRGIMFMDAFLFHLVGACVLGGANPNYGVTFMGCCEGLLLSNIHSALYNTVSGLSHLVWWGSHIQQSNRVRVLRLQLGFEFKTTVTN
eukprot:Gb_29707 [translate_table: standard]